MLDETTGLIGVLAAVAALYGFVLTYHVFARGLHAQELESIARKQDCWVDLHPDQKKVAVRVALGERTNLHYRQALLDAFLFVASVLFGALTLCIGVYFFTQASLGLKLALIGFMLFVGVAALWFGYIGLFHFKTTRQANWRVIAEDYDQLVRETRKRVALSRSSRPSRPPLAERLALANEMPSKGVVATAAAAVARILPDNTWDDGRASDHREELARTIAEMFRSGEALLTGKDLEPKLSDRLRRLMHRVVLRWPPV